MRKENWERHFLATIEFAGSKPFAWGDSDCCLFAAEVVNTITGIDYGEPFRDKYTSYEEAKAVLEEAGYLDITELLDERFERLETPKLAQRGDLVTTRLSLASSVMPAVGICIGDQAVFKSPQGLSYVKIDHCLDAWRV